MDRSGPPISRSVALHYRVLPDGFENGTLILLTDRPVHGDAVHELKRLCDSPIDIRRIDEKTFRDRMNHLYGVGAAALSPISDPDGIITASSGEPVVRFVSQILNEAAARNASDIHLEAGPSGFRIRLRIDGLMHTVPVPGDIDRFRPNITSRIKVLSGLDPTPSREPKDGRFKFGGRDLRVSILPALYGDSIHLRFLTPPEEIPDLCSLGFPPKERHTLLGAMKKSGGLIIACGPTGSGKSTTLHALIREGVPSTVKTITVEDPVEYELEGATQIEVTRDLPFSRMLRSVLRHDPDVMLVGEIRDTESAVIALEAALTGHLVLTSLHTDTEVQALNRFRQFGIPLALVASTLHLMISQRLVRIICRSCDNAEDADSSRTCERCGGSGYHGRTGIFRIVRVTEPIREAMGREDFPEIERRMNETAPSLDDACRSLVEEGKTTAEELLRVLGTGGGMYA